MAKAVSLNDVAMMLSTKGGDMSTIGGAIGCMTAMISGDARDKENTTSNDVRKIKEFIYGDGGSLSSMIDRIQLEISDQTLQIQKILEGNKEKKLVKFDITEMIKSATNGLEKGLDRILDSLNLIIKNQGGNVKWGNTKKMKDSIEQFKDSLSDKKKMKDSRIGKLVSMLTELKAISFKDLLLFKPKMMMLEKINPQINSFAKSLNEKKIAKVSGFLEKSPKMLENMNLTLKLAKKIKQKDLDKLYDILGISDKSKKPKRNSLLGIVNVFANLDKRTLEKSHKNANIIFGTIKDICLGIGTLVLFSPVILLAGIISKPLEWALFGFKGEGGLVGIFSKLSKKSNEIKKANKSIMWLGIGVGALGLGLGIMFALTKDVDWEQLGFIGASIVGLGLITAVMGSYSDKIKEGSKAMKELALGVGALGLGLGIMFALTKDVDWEQLGFIAVSIGALGAITAVLGLFPDKVKEGSKAMVWLGLGVGAIGLGLGIMFALTKNVDWEQMLIIGVSISALGGITYALGYFDKDGKIKEGSIAMAIMGAALIPFGFAMKLLMGSVRGIKWKEVGILGTSILALGGVVIGLGFLMCTGLGAIAWGAGLVAIAALGAALIPFGIGMQKLSKVSKEIDKNSIEELIKTTKNIFDSLSGVVSKENRKAAKKNAKALGFIGERFEKLGNSLKIFNEVGPDSIDKAMNAIKKISEYFFSEDSELNKMSIGFSERRKAKKNADAIGVISDCVWRLAKGLKDFNEVGPSSITNAKDAIDVIANYFFSPDSTLNSMNTGWSKRKKAKKNADAISVIADSMYKISQSLKDFQNVGGNFVDKVIESIDKIANYFFTKKDFDGGFIKKFKGGMKKLSDTIAYFNKKTKDTDCNKISSIVETFEKISSRVFETWKDDYSKRSVQIKNSIKNLIEPFDEGGKNYRKNVNATTKLFEQMSNPSFASAGETMRRASSFVRAINTVDMEKAMSLTEMFKSFASLGKTSNVFSNFDKRVKQFTDACIELVNAINGNTDAINNSEEEVTVKDVSGEEKTVKRKDAELMPKQMVMLNVDDLAMAIADQLNSLNVDCDANINLQINNESGNEWRISRM